MSQNGVRTTELTTSSMIDEITGNYDGQTVRQTFAELSNQLAASGTLGDAISDLQDQVVADAVQRDMDLTGTTDERDNLIGMLQDFAPRPVVLPSGSIVGLSSGINLYDKSLFPVKSGGLICDTPWIEDFQTFTGDGTTTDFVTTFPLYKMSVDIDGFPCTKRVQPAYEVSMVTSEQRLNDYQVIRPSRTVKFTIPPGSGETITIRSRRPGAMLKAIGDWSGLSNGERNGMLRFTDSVDETDLPVISGFPIHNIGFDCNGQATNATRGNIKDPDWRNIYVVGASSYSKQGRIVGGRVGPIMIDHVHPISAADAATEGLTAGEDVIVPAKAALTDTTTVSFANNGWDFSGDGCDIGPVFIDMHGNHREAGYWLNNHKNGSVSKGISVVDGHIGGEQILDASMHNVRRIMSGAMAENRLVDPEGFVTGWGDTDATIGASSETVPGGGTAKLLSAAGGAGSYPHIKQVLGRAFEPSFLSLKVKPETALTATIGIIGTGISDTDDTSAIWRLTFATGEVVRVAGAGSDKVRAVATPLTVGWWQLSIQTLENRRIDEVRIYPIYNATTAASLHVAQSQYARAPQSYAAAPQDLDAGFGAYSGKRLFGRFTLFDVELDDTGASTNVGIAVTEGTEVTVVGGKLSTAIGINANASSVFNVTSVDFRECAEPIASTSASLVFSPQSRVAGCLGLPANLVSLINGETNYTVENVEFAGTPFAASAVHTVQFNGAPLDINSLEVYEVWVFQNAGATIQHHARIRKNTGQTIYLETLEGGSGNLVISTSGDNIIVTNNGVSVGAQIYTRRVA